MTIDDIPEPLLGIMKANFNTEALGGSGSINLRDVLKRNPSQRIVDSGVGFSTVVIERQDAPPVTLDFLDKVPVP